MQSPGREPSMEDILASIKKVIAEEKGQRAGPAAAASVSPATNYLPENDKSDEVLELNEPLAAPVDLGPPLVDESVAGRSREALEQLSTVAATVPAPPPVNPLEEMVREMLRPMLKQWLEEHLSTIVQDHVRREITRITGRPL
ncbi:uncharacterized protein ACUXST_000217 [Sphingomonas sp. F9_3S_D5_B_2]